MVIRPYGYAIWETDARPPRRRFKETGHQNAYFPLFIPESFLKKEAEHVEGFAPEVAWVTHGGRNEPLEERLAVRPTSEAIICSMYAKWIRVYRDLPVLINQWANVVRWEKATRLFLRTTEFLWQEGHTVHRTAEEAEEETLQDAGASTDDFAEETLAIPVIPGRKSESEKFAGAVRHLRHRGADARRQGAAGRHLATTWARTSPRRSTSRFESREQTLEYVWQTSWGVTTRLIGGARS